MSGAAMEGALRGAEDASYEVRAAAGRELARWVEHGDVPAVLERLVLDPYDTGVTQATTEALLRRNDVAGLRIVLRALARAAERGVQGEQGVPWCTVDRIVGDVHAYAGELAAAGLADEHARRLRILAADPDLDPGVRDEALYFL
ncbi:hypothetical protein [Streptomyces sp. NPDC048172]|uniref:hypothetical protein n=1 Tax=Streptomyces sp. NPDC048172 TaxID=3365505 RepID=UPI003712E4C5